MTETTPVTPSVDPGAEYMRQANEREAAARQGKPIPEVKAAEPGKPEPKAEEEEDHDKRISRSDRRKFKFVEEAAELRGKVSVLEAFIERGLLPAKSETAAVKGDDDPEPQRTQFKTDAEYNRALGRWDARQEAKQVVGKASEQMTESQQQQAWDAMVEENFQKMLKDAKLFPDWDKVAEDMADDPDAPTITSGSQLDRLVKASEFRAHVLYHFAKNPDQAKKFVDMEDGALKTRNFGRLEAQLETLYTQDDKSSTAAQADPEKDKDRRHPAEAQAGRTSGDEVKTPKPKPSTEVAARGGSAAPDKPALGSPQWMAERNRLQYGR